jgi:PDDEXK-like domain of unknown function (DUF3799)
MQEYLALPAVSAGLLSALLDRCPRAAWWESWLNPNRVIETSAEMDVGTIAHGILLEGHYDSVAIIDPTLYPAATTGAIPDGWTNKAIRAARDDARVRGQIPILKTDFSAIQAMVEAANTFIASLKDTEPAVWRAFQPNGGESEVTLQWDDGETPCKMRPDRISLDHALIINYKTTSASVEPDRYGRTQFLDYYLGAAFYRRGIRSLYKVTPAYVFLCQETVKPYLCSLVGVDEHAFELGDAKVDAALNIWRGCVERGVWPGYPGRICYPDLPPWEENRWQDREIVDYGGQP